LRVQRNTVIVFGQFVMAVTAMSFDIRSHAAHRGHKRGHRLFSETIMPAYEICYLDEAGSLTYKFAAHCDDDQRAKVLAHAMKLPSAKKLEVWSGESLIYTRPSTLLDGTMRAAAG
jgi:hypothetical protein